MQFDVLQQFAVVRFARVRFARGRSPENSVVALNNVFVLTNMNGWLNSDEKGS